MVVMDPNSLLQPASRKFFGEPSAADLRRWRRDQVVGLTSKADLISCLKTLK
jgi:hypothetical protein